ncbi:MAG: hypothetical protein DRJ65_16760 [Acidobacteria bacterium]|nr:MAG: hypothetical protein DRJ65_16760 [Acidobacteriota bacterium]
MDRVAGRTVEGSSPVSMGVGKVEGRGYSLVAFDTTVPGGDESSWGIVPCVMTVSAADLEPNMRRGRTVDSCPLVRVAREAGAVRRFSCDVFG